MLRPFRICHRTAIFNPKQQLSIHFIGSH
jgi:hypothetical protein